MPSTSTDRLNGLTTSVAVKAPCRTVSTSNITLSGLQTFNGVTQVEGDRHLATGQTTGSENGIYVASTGSWTRAKDFDGNRDVVQGTMVPVVNGSGGANLYEVTTSNPIVIGTTSIAFTLRYGANTRYDQTASEIANEITPVNLQYPEGHVYRYATNTTPGTTDMTLAFQRASLVSLTPYAPGDEMLVSGTITIRANQKWTLDGTQIRFTGSTLNVFVATEIRGWSITGRGKIIGDGDGTQSGTAAALKVVDCNRYFVSGLECLEIRGWGVLLQAGSNTIGAVDRGPKGSIYGLIARKCYVGFEAQTGTGAEYSSLTTPMITSCNCGVRITAGNINVTGGNIVDNVLGVLLESGGNHAHGIFSGVQINHNTINIQTESVTLGHTFVGCHLYGGIIWFRNSEGVIFKSCTVDPDEYRFENSNGCGFIDCTMPQGNTGTITPHYSGTNSFALWRGNVSLLGAPFQGAPGSVVGIAASQTLAAPITFTPANLSGGSVVKMDTSGQISANDSTQAAYTVYSTTTGIYTASGKGDGHVRVRAQFFTSNSSTDANLYVMDMLHSALGAFYLNRVTHTSTSASFEMSQILSINAAETLQFRIAGTVGSNVSVQTSNTKVYIEGL